MAFRPLNPRNAILEAIVLVHFNRPVFEFEAAAVRALHPQLKADLPKLQGPPPNAVFMSQAPVLPGPLVTPGIPLSMASFKRDGSVDTRLLLNGSVLAVNFLVYTRWAELRPKVVRWMKAFLDALAAAQQDHIPRLLVNVVAHQMIDVFKWEGESANMAITALMAQNAGRIPEAAWSEVGHGWFAAHALNKPVSLGPLTSVNLVDFVSFDLADEQPLGWRFRMEHTIEARLATPQEGSDLFTESSAATILDGLHSRNQDLIRRLLRPELLSSIGMGT